MTVFYFSAEQETAELSGTELETIWHFQHLFEMCEKRRVGGCHSG